VRSQADLGKQPARPAAQLSYTRRALTLVFFLAGLAIASWAPHIPGVRSDLGLTAGGLGIALLNLMFRAGAGSDEERRQEEEAREYYTRHGRWPDA